MGTGDSGDIETANAVEAPDGEEDKPGDALKSDSEKADLIRLPSGDALDAREAATIAGATRTSVVVVCGPVESGKTHLILPSKRGRERTAEQTLQFLLEALLGKSEMPRILSAWRQRKSRAARRTGAGF